MNSATLQRLCDDREHNRPVALATRMPDGLQALVYSDFTMGELDLSHDQIDAARSLLDSNRSGWVEEDLLFVRSYCPPLRLLIIGAVHITQHLVPMAQQAGFQVTVIDPRRAFASEDRFGGIDYRSEWPDVVLREMALDRHTAVVTLTHDPKIDDPALHEALRSTVFYIGSLGSRRTHAQRVGRLREAGFGDVVERIHAPVGLNLGGRSPAEIAVAVLAEIIQVYHREPDN